MGLARAAGTDEQDVALLHDHIPEIGVGDDRIGGVTIPAIDETLEVVTDAQGEASLGDSLPDHELVQVGDQGLRGRNRGEPSLTGGSLRGRSWLWNGLGGDLGEGSGCAEGADACRRIEAALKKRDAGVETKITTDGLIFGHGDTKGRGVSGPPTPGSRTPPSMVSIDDRLTEECPASVPAQRSCPV